MAREICIQMADKLGRFLAGDETLIAEIHANARSTLPVHCIMRAAVDSESSMRIVEKRKWDEMVMQHEHEKEMLDKQDEMKRRDHERAMEIKNVEHKHMLQAKDHDLEYIRQKIQLQKELNAVTPQMPTYAIWRVSNIKTANVPA